MNFQLASLLQDSIVDGPGLRLAVFCQGCPHQCPGCHNPHTHPWEGTPYTTEQVAAVWAQNPLLTGLTLTGGEPFAQAEACVQMAEDAHRAGRNVITYTGYSFEELLAGAEENPAWRQLLAQSDWLIEGRFMEDQRTLSLPWRGSRNQRILSGPQSLAAGQAVFVPGFEA